MSVQCADGYVIKDDRCVKNTTWKKQAAIIGGSAVAGAVVALGASEYHRRKKLEEADRIKAKQRSAK